MFRVESRIGSTRGLATNKRLMKLSEVDPRAAFAGRSLAGCISVPYSETYFATREWRAKLYPVSSQGSFASDFARASRSNWFVYW
jgi:hypothetical protein